MADIWDQFKDAPAQGGSDPWAAFKDAPGAAVQSAAPVRAPPSASDHVTQVMNILRQHPMTATTGLAENALSGLTGGIGSLADAVTLSEPGTHDWAYRPRTEAGQQIAQAAADEAAAVGRGYNKLPGADTPLGQTLKQYAPEALGAVGTVSGLGEIGSAARGVRAPVPTAQDVVNRTVAASPQSMGAAAASPRVWALSPELQQAIVNTARKTGGAVNPEVLSRHIEADSLPVKVNLTAGQATQDPVLISHEQNLRGQNDGALSKHFNAQNDALSQNIQAIRDDVGPDVFSTNPAEHADTLIGAYKAKDAAAQSDISAKYQALKDANGGQFPVDARKLLDNATANLHKDLLFDHAPKPVMATLNRLAENGNMTFENFESLRTNLARIMRSSPDGNQIAAAGVIRNAMEQLPLAPGAANLKPLADAARTAARTQFDALDADPAYKAAVNDTVPPDRFVGRYVINAPRDAVAVMRQNLADNPTATQTLGVSVLDHLRDQARLRPDYSGNFSNHGFNKALQNLDPKLRSLVDAKTAEQLQTLGNVANYTQFQPKGSYVNNSNTLVGSLADYGGKTLRHSADLYAMSHGVPIPVGTVASKVFSGPSTAKAVKAATAPGAGLGMLTPRGSLAEAAARAARQPSGPKPSALAQAAAIASRRQP
jgi:hypothetical protein